MVSASVSIAKLSKSAKIKPRKSNNILQLTRLHGTVDILTGH